MVMMIRRLVQDLYRFKAKHKYFTALRYWQHPGYGSTINTDAIANMHFAQASVEHQPSGTYSFALKVIMLS